MTRRKIIVGATFGVLVSAILAVYFSRLAPAAFAAIVINTFRTANSRMGTLVVERRESLTAVAISGTDVASPRASSLSSGAEAWESFNRTLTSQRFSPLTDLGANSYAVDTNNRQRLGGHKLDGAVGGGVITYTAQSSQKVAVATGLHSIAWPADVASAKIVILGLGR